MPRTAERRNKRIAAAWSAFAGSRARRRISPVVQRSIGIARWCRLPLTAVLLGGLLLPVLPAGDNGKKFRKAKPGTAVESVMERQIRNAIDAGDGDLLVRSLRQKVVTEPGNVEARLALGAAYERQGASELAIEHYRVAATQYASETAASRLARALDELGEAAQAVEVLVQFCLSHERASSSILSELGILADDMSNLTTGEHYHRRALTAALVEAAPGQDALHNNLGYNLLLQKRFPEAEIQLRSALEVNPRSEVARNNLAFALASPSAATGAQVSEAILQWQSLSGPAAAHNNLAAVYMEQSRYPDARLHLKRALDFDRTNVAALKNLEWLAAVDGKPAEVPVTSKQEAANLKTAQAKPKLWKRLFARKHGGNKNQAVAAEVAANKFAK